MIILFYYVFVYYDIMYPKEFISKFSYSPKEKLVFDFESDCNCYE